ncbi:MAG TPA: hypothetical protein DCP61_03435 [Treponema sp.]|nr:hypothetical protein [Treponema sp.]
MIRAGGMRWIAGLVKRENINCYFMDAGQTVTNSFQEGKGRSLRRIGRARRRRVAERSGAMEGVGGGPRNPGKPGFERNRGRF